MRSTGNGSMITPVDIGSTCAGSMSSSFATAAQTARAFARPGAPVPALATPVFTTSARIGSSPSRCSSHTSTGAARKRLRVKTPATREPSSSATTSRSLRLGLRTPARAMPRRTPEMVSRSSARGGSRLTAIGAGRESSGGRAGTTADFTRAAAWASGAPWRRRPRTARHAGRRRGACLPSRSRICGRARSHARCPRIR